MIRSMIVISVSAALFSTGAWAASGSISGASALAMAGVVAPVSPTLSAKDKKEVAAFFNGNTGGSDKAKIEVTADKIVCRTSNVDVTARSCELTFGKAMKKLTGRAANEIYATEAMAGVPPEGAAGSNFESVSKLACTLDPVALRDKAGAGANCSYEPAN